MTQTVIIYAFVYHHNTKNAVDYVEAAIHANTIDILKTPNPDINGYDTFGALKVIGGIAKKHPNQKELDQVLRTVKRFCVE